MADQQLQKLQGQMQTNQRLQQQLGGQNPFLGALQARYAAPLSGPGPYAHIGLPLPQPAPFNFNVQPQMPPQPQAQPQRQGPPFPPGQTYFGGGWNQR